ncbi:hypothetical protein LAZ67_1003327 [Cordylochernes scorpioides]|uniref:Uncharacterized protein n=1 Tax=Cordylochernes scorpioides TaxID=51811 RepID=A0ABY6JZK0_9ARAC|nr:hypothetical protein LAZ67_1003327 [Cordylochernes scorpioides]
MNSWEPGSSRKSSWTSCDDLHFFCGTPKQLDTLSSQQEVDTSSKFSDQNVMWQLYLSGHIDQASTVEEVDSLVKKHDAFEKTAGDPRREDWEHYSLAADLAPKEMAASDMRNRCLVQPLLTWSTNAAHPVSLD